MEGASLLGQCASCCEPCGFADSWPDTIFITFSGLTPCACGTSASGNVTFDISDALGTFSIPRVTGNTWELDSACTITENTYFLPLCEGTPIPNDVIVDIQITAAPNMAGTACNLSVILAGNGFTLTLFVGGVVIPTGNPLAPIPNDQTACMGTGTTIASGGTATISL